MENTNLYGVIYNMHTYIVHHDRANPQPTHTSNIQAPPLYGVQVQKIPLTLDHTCRTQHPE